MIKTDTIRVKTISFVTSMEEFAAKFQGDMKTFKDSLGVDSSDEYTFLDMNIQGYISQADNIGIRVMALTSDSVKVTVVIVLPEIANAETSVLHALYSRNIQTRITVTFEEWSTEGTMDWLQLGLAGVFHYERDHTTLSPPPEASGSSLWGYELYLVLGLAICILGGVLLLHCAMTSRQTLAPIRQTMPFKLPCKVLRKGMRGQQGDKINITWNGHGRSQAVDHARGMIGLSKMNIVIGCA